MKTYLALVMCLLVIVSLVGSPAQSVAGVDSTRASSLSSATAALGIALEPAQLSRHAGADLLAAVAPTFAADAVAVVQALGALPDVEDQAAFIAGLPAMRVPHELVLTLPELPSFGSLDAAMEAFHAYYGIDPDPARQAALHAIEEPNAGAMTTMIEAHLFQAEATRIAYKDLDEAAIAALHESMHRDETFKLPFDLPLLVAARAIVAPLVMQAANDLVCVPDGDAVYSGELQYDLRCEGSVYTNPAHLLIDAGGHDLYRNNAGGGGDGLSTGPCRQPCAAILVDVSGHDEYRPAMNGQRHFSMTGGGYGGSGMLIDLDGTDLYHMQYRAPADRYVGAHGGGLFGVGLLFDGAGDDTYVADLDAGLSGRGAFTGGGYNGAGGLIDLGGSDVYDVRVRGNSINGGSAAANGGAGFGTGFLLDGGDDDDRYIVNVVSRGQSSVMANGGGGFGGGMLLDGGGNDIYSVSASTISGLLSVSANGASVAGQGLLVDLSGEDEYRAVLASGAEFNSAANGGSGGGASLLWDLGGDDVYLATGTAAITSQYSANGGGALGDGAIVDAGGNDRYMVHAAAGTSLNVGANGGGVIGSGRLLDLGGNDDYHVTGSSAGSFNVAANGGAHLGVGQNALLGGVGFLLDVGGTDTYSDHQLGGSCADCTVLPKGNAGAQIDG